MKFWRYEVLNIRGLETSEVLKIEFLKIRGLIAPPKIKIEDVYCVTITPKFFSQIIITVF